MAYKALNKFTFSSSEIDNINSIGVYQLSHIAFSDEIYVGSTAHRHPTDKFRSGFYSRWGHHISSLKLKKHPSLRLQEIVDAYGIDGIRFKILRKCDDKESSLRWEQHYIETIKPSLNTAKHVDGPVVAVIQHAMNGMIIKEFHSMAVASRELGIDRGSINNCALGNRPSAGGFLWSFDGEPVHIPVKRLIEKWTLDGSRKLAEYNSLGEIMADLKLTSSTAIRNCMLGKQRKAYGYVWKETVAIHRFNRR